MNTPKDIFEYDNFSPNRHVIIRYGIADCKAGRETGVVLLLHGRSEFIEKYKQVAGKLQGMGFIVVSPDWRGQGLSSRETENRQKGHINRFEDYLDDLEVLVSSVVTSYGLPVYILAHSMGGHIALRYMSRWPLKIKKAILASPMIDMRIPWPIKPLSKVLARRFSNTLFSEKYTIGSTDYSIKNVTFKGNNLCHDPDKYLILHDEIKNNPDLALGGVTWGWLDAAFDSIERLKNDDVIKNITPPVLMVNAQKDAIVSSNAQKELSRKLPNCTFLSIKGAFHELLFEEPGINNQFWEAFRWFIAQ